MIWLLIRDPLFTLLSSPAAAETRAIQIAAQFGSHCTVTSSPQLIADQNVTPCLVEDRQTEAPFVHLYFDEQSP